MQRLPGTSIAMRLGQVGATRIDGATIDAGHDGSNTDRLPRGMDLWTYWIR